MAINRTPKRDEDEDDDIDMGALTEALESGDPSKIAAATAAAVEEQGVTFGDEVIDDEDSTASQQGDADGDEGSPADADATAGGDDSGDGQAGGGDGAGGQADGGSGDTESGDADSATQTLGPAAKALAKLGWDAANLTEDQAAEILADQAVSGSRMVNDNAHLLRLGQFAATNLDKIAPLFGQGGMPQQTAQTQLVDQNPQQAPASIAKAVEIAKRLKATGPAPEYDPSWAHSGVLFDGAWWIAPPDRPQLQATADKLNAHRKWQLGRLDAVTGNDLPEALEALAEAVAKPQQTVTPEIIQQHIQAAMAQQSQQNYVQNEIFAKNQAWMFQHDKAGNIVQHPQNGQRVLTDNGKLYFGYMQMLDREGIKDVSRMHSLALALMHNKIAAVDTGKSPANTQGQSGKSLDHLSTLSQQGDSQKQKGKQAALRQPVGKTGLKNGKPVSQGQNGQQQASPKNARNTLAAALAANMKASGITDADLKFGDDED